MLIKSKIYMSLLSICREIISTGITEWKSLVRLAAVLTSRGQNFARKWSPNQVWKVSCVISTVFYFTILTGVFADAPPKEIEDLWNSENLVSKEIVNGQTVSIYSMSGGTGPDGPMPIKHGGKLASNCEWDGYDSCYETSREGYLVRAHARIGSSTDWSRYGREGVVNIPGEGDRSYFLTPYRVYYDSIGDRVYGAFPWTDWPSVTTQDGISGNGYSLRADSGTWNIINSPSSEIPPVSLYVWDRDRMITGYGQISEVWCAQGMKWGGSPDRYVLDCVEDGDCGSDSYCDKSRDWDDWDCRLIPTPSRTPSPSSTPTASVTPTPTPTLTPEGYKTPTPTPTCEPGIFSADYYDNRDLQGSPVFSDTTASIDYDWGRGNPGYGLNSDNFSIRWWGRFNFDEREYLFTARSDDGIKVYVDDNQIIDGWWDHSATTFQNNLNLSAGLHTIKVEYYEAGADAVAQARWEVILTPTPIPTATPTVTPTPCVVSLTFDLVTTERTNVNAISLPGNDLSLITASDLATQIGSACTAVAYWDAVSQKYIEHTVGIPIFNFDINPGYPYFVTVGSDIGWTFEGECLQPWPAYKLITTSATNVNAVVLPLDKTDITTAQELGQEIGPECAAVARWDAENQGYIEHTIGYPVNNFPVLPGYPYFVTVTEGITWP